jgi:hypothetical protein
MAEGEQDVPEHPVDDRERLLQVAPEKTDASTVANQAIKQPNAADNLENVISDHALIVAKLATSRRIARIKAKIREPQEPAAETSRLWISDVWRWHKGHGKLHASQSKWPQ